MTKVEREQRLAVRKGLSGLGLFAIVPFVKGQKVVQYKGRQIVTDMPGNPWNVTRYANHSCRPNCAITGWGEEWKWLTALRDIEPGEEITYTYESPHFAEIVREGGCRCGHC